VILTKSVFQVHGVDASGKVVLKKKLSREGMMNFFQIGTMYFFTR